jgi:hypothetical protein
MWNETVIELLVVPSKDRREYIVVQRGDHQRIIVVLLPHVHDVKLRIFVEMLMKW